MLSNTSSLINKTISNFSAPLIYGEGGFFPYGYYGVIRSMTKCYYAYIGKRVKDYFINFKKFNCFLLKIKKKESIQ